MGEGVVTVIYTLQRQLDNEKGLHHSKHILISYKRCENK